jgi:hypothetical protein
MPSNIQNGYDIAQGLIKHKINPVLAVSMMAEPDQQADLALFIESLTLPPLPVQRQFYANGRPKPVQPPKPDKVKETTYRCFVEAARAKRMIRSKAKWKALKFSGSCFTWNVGTEC